MQMTSCQLPGKQEREDQHRLTVTFLSKNALRVRLSPRIISVRNNVCALSSSTLAKSFGTSRCAGSPMGFVSAREIQSSVRTQVEAQEWLALQCQHHRKST